MKRASHLAVTAVALALVACAGRDDDSRSDTAGGALAPLDTAGQGLAPTDTMATPGMAESAAARDSAAGSRRSGDTSAGTSGRAGDQTQSGVTDTRTGASTLGPGVTKTSPTQGAPVTSKGDTIARGRPPR